MRLAEGAAGAAGSLAPALGTLPALLLATLATVLPALAGYYALRSFLRSVRHTVMSVLLWIDYITPRLRYVESNAECFREQLAKLSTCSMMCPARPAPVR